MAPDPDRLWRLTLEHSPVGMAVVDLDGHLLIVNDAYALMLGYPRERLMTLSFQEITHPDDLDADLHLLHETLAGERTSYRMRKRYFHADGHVVWCDLSVALVRDDDGAPVHFISQILDVTAEVRAAEEAARAAAGVDRERRAMQAIFDAVDVALSLIDREGHIERANRKHDEFAALAFPGGRPPGSDTAGGFIFGPDGVTPLRADEAPENVVMAQGRLDGERLWVGADPTARRALTVSGRTVHDAAGEPIGAALSYQDVTDLVRALQIKDEFLATVSHELRTPLTSMIGYLEMVQEEELPADLARALEVIDRNTQRLHRLVVDLLQVAQTADDGVGLQWIACDVGECVSEAVDAVRDRAARGGLTVEVDAPFALVARLDRQRLRQLLGNLLSNAVKFTDPGGTVRVQVTHDDEHLQIAISDTGLGMTPEEVGQLFTRFFRAAEVQARHIPGTGLGLPIVKSLVGALGGEISVDSARGVGSTFTVTLPLVRE